MKKLFLFLIPCLLMQSFAFGATTTLKEVMDAYHFDVTVNWDQKDADQLAALNEQLRLEVLKLVKNGLSVDEVNSLINESALANRDQEIISLLRDESGNINAEKMMDFVQAHSGEFYQDGASWAPDALSIGIYGTLGLLLVWAIVDAATTPDDICKNPNWYGYDVTYTCEH